MWDEENRLEAINTNGFIAGYWYDALGERVVKTSGDDEGIYVNDVFSGGRTETANFTAYVNPYLIVSKGGRYTKHIYIGSQRIVSKLGDSDSYGPDPRRIEYAGASVDGAKVDYKAKYKQSQQTIKDRYKAFEVPYYGKDNDDYVNGSGFCCDNKPMTKSFDPGKNDNPELYQYYYHSDHLGSSSLITNLDGEVVQHIEYVPFGEVFIEERNTTWNTPYLFNAKELDEETGLYYYGARYYDPISSVWLSTDPLQEKYPNISSYAYCSLNPVKYIDPDGRIVRFYTYNKSGKYDEVKFHQLSTKIQSALGTFIMSPQGRQFISQFISGTQNIMGIELSGNAAPTQNLDFIFDDGTLVVYGNGGAYTRIGLTDVSIRDNGLFGISIYTSQNLSIGDMLTTLGHEAFLHGMPRYDLLSEIMKDANISQKEAEDLYNKSETTAHEDHKNHAEGKRQYAKLLKSYYDWLIKNIKPEVKIEKAINE